MDQTRSFGSLAHIHYCTFLAWKYTRPIMQLLKCKFPYRKALNWTKSNDANEITADAEAVRHGNGWGIAMLRVNNYALDVVDYNAVNFM